MSSPPPDTTRALPAGLAERLIADAPAVLGFHGSAEIRQVSGQTNPYSDVFRAELACGRDRALVFIKLPRRGQGNEAILDARLAAEHRILGQLFARFGDAGPTGVVRPFAYYPELLAIVTVAAEGDTLRRHVSRHARRVPFSRSGRLTESVELCGAWLREFHDATRQGAARFDVAELLEYCEVRLIMLTGRTAFGGHLSDRLLQRIRTNAAAVAAKDNIVAGRHNDFAGHNIIVGDKGIRVLDFSMFDYGSTCFDVCNFWNELEMLRLDPTYSPRLIGALQEAFLKSYGAMSPAHPLFALVRCRYVLNRLLTVLDQHGGGPFSILDRRRIAHRCRSWLNAFAHQ